MVTDIRLLTLTIAVLLGFTPAIGADVLVRSSTGHPYGIASIELPMPTPVIGKAPAPLSVTDERGRVMFPISSDIRIKVGRPSEQPIPRPGNGRLLGRFGKLLRELTSDAPQLEQTVARRVTFLFQGDQPLTVRLSESNVELGVYEVKPVEDAGTRSALVTQWWTAFAGAAKNQIDVGDYPPWVENYLVAMLAGQTGVPVPAWFQESEQDDDQLLGVLKMLMGTEAVGEAVFRRAAAGDLTKLQATALPLPAPPKWVASSYPPIDPGIAIEPLATRVPPECFYLRYGNFANYLWFRDLSDEYGGDLSRMITLRGVNDDAALRVEQQLNLKMTQLTRMLGSAVIEDQALFGRDMFLSDGATIGVVMKAKNVFLLKSSINGDRAKAAKNDPDLALTNLKLAGKEVTLLSSSDNRVRSFMAIDDEYVCFSNSERLVERFLEVAESGESLGSTEAFRLARQLMPLSRGDTIFAYFSPLMLQGLVSPQYLIELRRRLHAKSDIALVRLARIASNAAGHSLIGIDDLIEGGYLPAGFGQRPDGSGVISFGDDVIDTLRGDRGTFLPIADVKFESVTQEESDWYERIAAEYSNRFQQIDPVMIGVQRETVESDEKLERLVAHAEVAPLVPEKYGKLAKQLGPPTRVAMNFAPDDIVAIQAHVASEQIGPPTHLFVGVKDTVPPQPEQFDGILNTYRALQQVPGYLGAWPQPGAIDRLPLGLGKGRPVGPGMRRLIGGLYRYTDDGFSVLSFQNEVLNATLPFLEAKDVDDLATVRLRVGSLKGSQLEGYVNDQLYRRAAVSSDAGANFLNLLSRQLKVPPADALSAANKILGSELQCPLGGEYQYSQPIGRWISTAWNGNSPAKHVPDSYVSPVLNWFRGAEATLIQYADRLVADAAVTVKRQ